MKMIYNVKDKPKFGQLIVFAFQQLLAIMAATIVVPGIINGNISGEFNVDPGMSASAALFGAGIGTLIYVLFTKAKSPVFLGSSFAFIPSMGAAFAGAITAEGALLKGLGYLGLILGAVLAGLVYVVIAIVVKFVGVKWISKIMPAVVIGPTVAIIGLSLAGSAVDSLQTADTEGGSVYVAVICGLVTLAVTMLCSVFGKKMGKLIPFILGILAGYCTATVLYFIGDAVNYPALKVINFSALTENFKVIGLSSFIKAPDFTFLTSIDGFKSLSGSYIVTLISAYVPVAFVVFAEHIADHKNLSSIIGQDLLEDPGLSRTLLGDGVGSMVGALFGGCPNTTYGESIGCVAITKNASVRTIIVAACEAILISFLSPFVAFLSTIPNCVMGGVCIALYGFIAVSGLKMLQKVNLDDSRNLFTASVILIAGVGGFALTFGQVVVTEVACALILGILTNVMLSKGKKEETAPAKKGKKK